MAWLIRNNLKAVAEQKIQEMEIVSLQIQQGWHQQLIHLGAILSSVSIFLLTRRLWHVPDVYYFYNDEYGTVSGIVTLENILEAIIGPVEDEFDDEQPEIVSEGPKQYTISGNTSIDAINQRFGLKLEAAHDVDTIAGLMIARTDKLLAPGDRVELSGAIAEVLEVRGPRAILIRLTLSELPPDQKK
jgi:hypothetical protein